MTKDVRFQHILKRLFDIDAAILGIFLFAPLLIIVILAIRITMGKPVFFRQQRLGYKGKPFKLYKFRTMSNAVDASGNLLPDSMRITKLGNFVRKTSIDELIALFNVLKGEMSFVGPRPLLLKYLVLYDSTQIQRLDVKPGITGWAQVHGRNTISWEKKFELDVWYVHNQNFLLDILILFMTFANLFKNINHPGNATMPEWTGTKRAQQ